MSINFNIVKKPKKEEIEEEEVLEDDDIIEENEIVEKEEKTKLSFDPKKSMIKFMGIIVIVVILIILLLSLLSSCTRKKSSQYKYSEIETILVKAAKSYFKDHPSYLPVDEGDIVEVDYTSLVNEGKMRDLSYYTKEGVNCTASVKVENIDKDYNYSPDLNCGDDYSTILLSEKILKDNNTVTSGYGLYSIKGSYVFRGEEVDNYVSIDDILWRIVKINSNKNVVLISAEEVGYIKSWDNRYNEDTKYDTGKNIYANSRMNEYLNKIYKGNSKDENYYISNKLKGKLASQDLCVGKKDINSESKDNSEECLETSKNQKIGLLTVSEYLMASVDPNCKSVLSKSCKNYNYLSYKKEWWLMTAVKGSSSEVFMVSSSGVVKKENASTYAYIRPVIYLDDDVMYKSGKGTLEKPYKIR